MTAPQPLPRNARRAARLRRKIATVAMGFLAVGLLAGVGIGAGHSSATPSTHVAVLHGSLVPQNHAETTADRTPASPDGSGWN